MTDFDKDVRAVVDRINRENGFDYSLSEDAYRSSIIFAHAIRDLLQGSAEPVACEDEGCPHYGTPHSHPDETFERELRYVVLKWKDITEALSPAETDDLRHLMWKTHDYRERVGKSRYVDCVVVEADWPEYEPTWKAIEDRMTGNTRANLPPEQQEELERLRKYSKYYEDIATETNAQLADLRAENADANSIVINLQNELADLRTKAKVYLDILELHTAGFSSTKDVYAAEAALRQCLEDER